MPAKMDEWIEMPFGWVTWVGPRNHVLDGAKIPRRKGQFLGVVQPFEKHYESTLWCTQQKSVISATAAAICIVLNWCVSH